MASGYASYANRCESRERSKRHHSACHVVNCRNRRDCTVHLAKSGHSQGRSPSWRSRIPSLAGDSHGAGSRRGGGCNCPSLLLAGYDVLDHSLASLFLCGSAINAATLLFGFGSSKDHVGRDQAAGNARDWRYGGDGDDLERKMKKTLAVIAENWR